MPKRWFRVPRIGDGSQESPYRPKYGDLVERTFNKEIAEPPRFISQFEAEEEVLDEIAEKDGAEPLSEVEARDLLDSAEPPERKKGNRPRPPEAGQGSSIAERVDDFVERAERSSTVEGGDGTMFSRPVNLRYNVAFIEKPLPRQDLETLREFPRFLFDLILRPETSTISHEFFMYWDWTSEVVNFALSNGDEYGSLVKPEEAGRPSEFAFSGTFKDFFSMVELMRLSRKLRGQNDRVVEFILDMTGLTRGTDEFSMLRLHGPSTLSILDGLVSRRCGMDKDSNPEEPKEKFWRPEDERNGGWNYHDVLQYWRHYVATDTVSETLGEIDDLDRYNQSYLRRMAGVMGNEETLNEELGSTNHFLRILASQRNYNIHGNGSSPTIAPLALSLCCLVFWDIIDEDAYKEYQEKLLRQMNN